MIEWLSLFQGILLAFSVLDNSIPKTLWPWTVWSALACQACLQLKSLSVWGVDLQPSGYLLNSHWWWGHALLLHDLPVLLWNISSSSIRDSIGKEPLFLRNHSLCRNASCFLALLRYSWHLTLCKCKVYNPVIWKGFLLASMHSRLTSVSRVVF